VQDAGTYYVHTQRGIEHKTQFYIPKKLFRSYDGRTVVFDVSQGDADQFVGTRFPSDAEYRAKYELRAEEKSAVTPTVIPSRAVTNSTGASDIVERIPLLTERLDVSKHLHADEVTITKVPYMETQTKDIDVTHEELRVETVKPSSSTKIPEFRRDLTQETIRIPVTHEDVDVAKTPEVREELLIRKTPVTETRRISEEIRSEKYEVSDKTKATLEEEKKKHSRA
jgi:uncharacterized protein (TIGR02271 family)